MFGREREMVGREEDEEEVSTPIRPPPPPLLSLSLSLSLCLSLSLSLSPVFSPLSEEEENRGYSPEVKRGKEKRDPLKRLKGTEGFFFSREAGGKEEEEEEGKG